MKLIDRRNEPPGSWTWTMDLRDGTVRRFGPAPSFSQLLRDVQRFCLQNSYRAPTEAQMEAYFCRKTAGRGCVQGESRTPGEMSPHIYGPWIWSVMHLHGLHFRKDSWLSLMNFASGLLAAVNSHGCVQCARHWADWLDRHPPDKVESASEAAVWSWAAHDNANNVKKTAPNRLTLHQAADLYGWRLPNKAGVDGIKTKLGITDG